MTKTAPTIRPLQGIRVLDLSSFISGPFCTTQLEIDLVVHLAHIEQTSQIIGNREFRQAGICRLE